MTGKRQHFLPRFLQKGFASRVRGDDLFTWVYGKDKHAFETNTINVGVEGKFYAANGDSEVDRMITEAEGGFASAIDQLRAGAAGPVAAGYIPELLAHLEVRTRNLRQVFLRGGSYIVTRLVDFLEDREAFKDFLRRRMQRDPSLLRKAVRGAIRERGLPPRMVKTFLTLAKRNMPALMEQIDPYLTSLAQDMRPRLPGMMTAAAKSGHIKALKQAISPPLKVEKYKRLSFYTVDLHPAHMMLGDSALVFLLNTPGRCKPFLEGGNELKAVLLPLSPARLLVGSSQLLDMDLCSVRHAIVRCSLEFFVSAHCSDANAEIAADIGLDAEPLSQSQLEEIVGEVMTP
jgi:hypothetical protein